MIDLDIHDFWNLDTDVGRAVRFLFMHADHDLCSADEPKHLKYGFLCCDCKKSAHIRVLEFKKLASSPIREFLIEVLNRRHKSFKDYVLQYKDISRSINKLHCMI